MKYQHKTRIGNWSEELELEETKLKDFLKNKEAGTLHSTQLQQKIDKSLLRASLTYSGDGLVHFGDHLMLLNKETDGFLVTDIYDPIKGTDEGYHAFTGKNTVPSARSVFIIKKYTKEQDLFQDNIVHYGQKVQFQVNPLLVKKELYLHSCHVTPIHVARFSRKQEAGFFAKNDYNTVWTIEHIDPKVRFENTGNPVLVGEPILLKHCQTAQWLASDPTYPIKNDFGTEYEVFGFSFQTLNKTQNLIAEKTGRTTTDIPSRNQKDQNCWAIVLASDPKQEFDESVLSKPLDVNDYLNLIRKKILDKGSYGFRDLLNHFRKIDVDNTGGLEKEDFKWGLRNYGVILSSEELNTIFNTFDRNKNGQVDFQEFLAVIKGEISSKRVEIIRKAYENIANRLNGDIKFENLVQTFDEKNHPDVKRGLKTDKEAFREFANAWNVKDADKEITFDDFFAYYADVSSGYEKDENFQLMMHSVWNFK